MIRNVVTPTLTAYLPEKAKASGTAIVICPGGGFRFHSWDSEGVEVAKWLRERGVAAFVLKYRVMDTGATEQEFQKHLQVLFAGAAKPAANQPAPLQPDLSGIIAMAKADGLQAMKVVRQHAAEWNVSPDRVGILGFSAGGVVTMGVVMGSDVASHPNFAVPIYGGTTGGAPVPADAPPLFILCANDDNGAAINSAKLYSDWKSAGKQAEIHIYSKGGHGFGMRKQNLPIDGWIDRLGEWLDVQGLLKAAK
jgi:acetyl esterase/lipase